MRRYLLLILCFASLQLATEILLFSDDLIYDSLINQLSYERISELLNEGKKWKWLSYIFLPVLLFTKILFVVICFSSGALLTKLEIGFRRFFLIVTTAEFIFVIPVIIKFLWFRFFEVNYTLQDLHFFFRYRQSAFSTEQILTLGLFIPFNSSMSSSFYIGLHSLGNYEKY